MAIRTADLKTRLNTQIETLTTGGAAAAGTASSGDDINAYAKAMKIVNDNSTFIDGLATSNVAYDLVEEMYFSHSEDNNSGTNVTLADSTTTAVVAGANKANGFNALFISNGIDQLRQTYEQATTLASINYKLTTAVGSSALTIALKNDLGNDPSVARSVQLIARDGTAITSGVSNTFTSQAATSVVVPSTALLGTTDGVEATIYIYAINNSGTVVLGVTGGTKLDEGIIHASTDISTGADSASVLYSASTVSGSKPVRLIGKLRHTQSTAGTWASAGTELTLADHIDSGRSRLAANERIEWQDAAQYIEGTTTGITIEADDNFVVNTDTVAQLNSTTKVDLVAPTTNVVSTTAFDANTPSFIVRSATAQKPVVDIQNDGNDATGPILRLINNRSGDGADNDQAGRIEFHSKDDGTPTDFIVAQQFANVADATSGSKDGLWSLQVMSNQTLTNRIIADSAGVAVTGTLTVSGDLTISGTTTTVDSSTVNVVDPIMSLGGGDGGTAAASPSSAKDRGLELKYYTGSAKSGFMGWDISASEFIFANDGTIATEVYTPAATGYANIHTGAQIKVGNAQEEDIMVLFDGHSGGQDWRIGIDDSADTLEIGVGGTMTTTPAIQIAGGTRATTLSGALTVGVDDTGYDVKLFGDTASSYLEWDTSAMELEIRGPIVTPGKLLLSTAEPSVVDGNKLGQIDFQAPLDGAGTDAILVGASIWAEANDTFATDNNTTDLVFATAITDTAAETMRLSSAGILSVNGIDMKALNNRIDLDADNDTSIRASADDTITIEVAGSDLIALTSTATFSCPVTVGVDNTGHDVIFYGETTGKHLLWDQSGDELLFATSTKLSFHDAAGGENILASADGHLEVNAGTTLDITAPTVDINASTLVQIDGPVSVGVDDAGHDVIFYGYAASANMTWDASADDLILNGAAGLIVPDGKLTLASTAVGSTAAELNLLDGSAKSTSSITVADADAVIVIDGTTTKQIPASDFKTYAGFDGALAGADVDLSALSSGNNANTTLILGSTTSECLNVTANNVTGAATLSSVNFITKTASTDSNIGQMTFSVDEATAQLTINDAGITATTITESSDTELKTNITPLEGSLDKIMALQGVNFDWKEGENKQIGLLADDVAKVVPEFVQFEKRGKKKKAVALQYSKMVALLIEGMKEQQQEINELKKLIPKS